MGKRADEARRRLAARKRGVAARRGRETTAATRSTRSTTTNARNNAGTRSTRGRSTTRRTNPTTRAAPRRTNRVWTHCTTRILPQRFYDKYEEGIKTAAEKWRIKNYQKDPKYIYEGATSTRVGSSEIAQSCRKNYECCYKQLWNFCLITGDYDSMFILMSPPPWNCVPVQIDTAIALMKFKRLAKGTVLKDTAGRNVVKDIFGNPIKADGRWDNPRLVGIYRSALMTIHTENKQGGNYFEKCDDCCDDDIRCDIHGNSPQYRRSGNPALDSAFVNKKKKYLKMEGYKEIGTSQLLPMHLRKLRAYYLSAAYCLGGLSMFTCALIACRDFLRHDELHTIKAEDVKKVLHEILDKIINGLCINILGKADKNWVLLMLWADDEWPDLCPVRHLLIYLWLTEHKGGYLFPSEQELHNPPADRIYKTYCPYNTFMDQFKKICANVLGPGVPEQPNKFGAASFRKTGYLLGVFGGGGWQELMHSARHSSVPNATRYYQCAGSLYERHKDNGSIENGIGKFKSIRVESVTNAQDVSASRGKQIEFEDLASYFVRECLGVPVGHPKEKDVHYLFEKAKHYRQSENPRDKLNKMMRTLPADQAEEMKRVMYEVIADDVSRLAPAEEAATGTNTTADTTEASTNQEGTTTEATTGTTRPAEQAAAVERPNKRARKEPSELANLPKREGLKKLKTTKEKVQLLLEIEPEVPSNPSTDCTNGGKNFFYTQMSPVLNCLKLHFGGDIDKFCTAYPNMKHTTFKLTCCAGAPGTTTCKKG